MVKEGIFTAKWALVADEKLGWGKRINGPDASVLPDSPAAARVVAALREEPQADDFEDDAEIERFLADAISLEQNYKDMLADLKTAGTKIVRYGRDNTSALLSAFRSAGLKILGPTDEHLEICRRAIAASMQDAVADAVRMVSITDSTNDIEIYRRLASDSSQDALADVSRLGSALNDQSIVLALGSGTGKVLLTGDMQFSDAAVNGLDDEMETLRQTVVAAGPFRFVKLSHHGSHNGIDSAVRTEWAQTKLFAVSGGSKDPGHPAHDVLKLLRAEQASITWARTDKNGRIEVRPTAATQRLRISKGALNDSTANPRPPRRRRDDEQVVLTSSSTRLESRPGASGPLEIIARVPDNLRRVVITIESNPRSETVVRTSQTLAERKALAATGEGTFRETEDPRGRSSGSLGGGRTLPPLLFASNRRLLGENIGRAEADAAISMITDAGQTYVDVTDPARAFAEVVARITDRYQGVVLLGGYDVLPAHRLDTLPQEVRETLGDDADNDADNFIVWSDAAYGDKDQDEMPELPVSRIPDGKSSQLVLNALQAKAAEYSGERFSVYNAKRPFAVDVIQQIPGTSEAHISFPSTSDNFADGDASAQLIYFMLHGMDNDATRFAGQEPEYPEAFNIDLVPKDGGGLVFTGCCWGALTVRQIASRVRPGRSIMPRTPDQSIALRFLRAGYNAFVGCTGSHYSPPEAASLTHGKPMHLAFWNFIREGKAPAEALFQAKIQYLNQMPHGLEDFWDIAIEHKILRQFTCLGLGW